MDHFIAYHSTERMGREYQAGERLQFLSKKIGLLRKAVGNTVWVVQGSRNGKRTDYTLHGAYLADSVAREVPSSDTYVIRGTRVIQFVPPLELNGASWLPSLLASQKNFSLGFNRLSDDSVLHGLVALQASALEPPGLPDLDLAVSAAEGDPRLASHLRRERNRALIESKKAATLAATGSLCCEACHFNFAAVYGALGKGLCEVHHLVPLSASAKRVTTTLADLAVLCSNCHRIIHRSNPMLAVSELATLVKRGRP